MTCMGYTPVRYRDENEIAELHRKIGFARAQIEEALGLLEDVEKSDAKYWAYRALVRANDELRKS